MNEPKKVESPLDRELKKKKRRKIIIWTVVGGALLTLITGNYGAYQIMKINRQKSELVSEIDALKKEQERLTKDREKAKTDLAFIEKIAREKYSMIREGERVYQMIPKTTPGK